VTDFTKEDLTVRDLFSQAQLEEVHYDANIAALYCQYIMEGNSLRNAASEIWAVENPNQAKALQDLLDDGTIDENVYKRRFAAYGQGVYKKLARWRIVVSKFDDMVNLAMKQRCYYFLEETLEIADDATDDAIMGAQGPMINGKAIRRAELQINTRKFVMAKLLPKVFGDKTQMELTGADGKDLGPTQINIQLIPQGSFISQDQALKEAEERDGG
jgi:hypothetical protein